MQFSNPLDNVDSGIPGVTGVGLNTNNSGMVNFSTGDPNAGLGTSTVPGTIDLTGTSSTLTPSNVTPPTLDANLGSTPAVSTGTSTGMGTTGTGTNGVVSNFPANTNGTVPGTGVNDLNPANLLGFNSTDPSQLISQLDSLFGKGVGQVFYNFLSSGAGYNSNVSTALANANAPYEERSRNNILESFGASGGRYGSPAAIGLGDFESSYALGQQSIFANEYDKSVDRYAKMFGGILDTAHLEQANKLGVKDILGGLLSALGGSKPGGGSGSGGGGNLGDIVKQIQKLFIPKAQGGFGLPLSSLGGFSGLNLNPTSPNNGSGNSNSSITFDPNNFDPNSWINPDGSINWDNLDGQLGLGPGTTGTNTGFGDINLNPSDPGGGTDPGTNDYSWLWDTFGFTDPSGATGDTGEGG